MMVVECEGCGTRFNLPDGQVPAGGARVRCSKCHHRFVVTPEGTPAATQLTSEKDSPAPGGSSREEPNLDNPEFIFDDGAGDGGDDDEDPADEQSGEKTENPDLEQTLLTGNGDADDEEDRPDRDDGEEVFGDDGEDDDSAPSGPTLPPSVRPSSPSASPSPSQVTATQAMDIAPQQDVGGNDENDRTDFGSRDGIIGNNDADADADADAEASPFGDTNQELLRGSDDGDDLGGLDDDDWATADDPMSNWDQLLGGDGPPPGARGARGAREVQPARVNPLPTNPTVEKPEAPAPPSLDSNPRLSSEIVDRVSRVLAIAAGLLLAVGGLRAISQHSLGPTPGPEIVRGSGWAADQIDSMQLRDAAGRRVVVVRGSLTAPGERTVPPKVRAILLDASGDPVGQPVEAHLERLSAEQLTPDALSRRMSRGIARAARSSGGFTILIPDPPIEARRFDLRLEPRS